MTRERLPAEWPKPEVVVRALRRLRDAIERADDRDLLCPAARGVIAPALEKADDVLFVEASE